MLLPSFQDGVLLGFEELIELTDLLELAATAPPDGRSSSSEPEIVASPC
jgi:hypothetical protein